MNEEEKKIVENENYVARKKIFSDDIVDIILLSKTEEHNLFDEMFYAIVKSFSLGYYRAKKESGLFDKEPVDH